MGVGRGGEGGPWKWRGEIAQQSLSGIPMDLEDDGGREESGWREGRGGVGRGVERNPGVTPRHGSRVAPHHFQDVALRAI